MAIHLNGIVSIHNGLSFYNDYVYKAFQRNCFLIVNLIIIERERERERERREREREREREKFYIMN